MHPKDFVDQSPDALRLTLVDGVIDPNQFTMLASDTFVGAEVLVEATVIGASHIITFDTGDFVLHEVFACVSVPDVASWKLDELTTPLERQLPGMRYEFSMRRIAWRDPEPPELLELVASARSTKPEAGLVWEFEAGNFSVIPKTVIVGYADRVSGGVIIETAHSYPTQGLILSRSTLYHTKEV